MVSPVASGEAGYEAKGGVYMTQKARIEQLYNRLLESSEFPITEEAILSKGLCLSENGFMTSDIRQRVSYTTRAGI